MGLSGTSCPKCGGILMPDRRLGVRYEECLQCGYIRFLGRHILEFQPEPPGDDRNSVDWLDELPEETPPRLRQSGRSRKR
jgi:ribosomal protein S27AE